MYITNTFGLNLVKPNVRHDTYLSVMIHSFYVSWLIYPQKLGQPKIYHVDATSLLRQLRKSIREQNTFHAMYVPPVSREEPMEHVYSELSGATKYSQTKLDVMSASDYTQSYW